MKLNSTSRTRTRTDPTEFRRKKVRVRVRVRVVEFSYYYSGLPGQKDSSGRWRRRHGRCQRAQPAAASNRRARPQFNVVRVTETSSATHRLSFRPSAAGMFHTPSVICREDDLCRSSGGRSGGGGRAHRHRIDKYLDTLLANQPISDGEDTDHCQKGAPQDGGPPALVVARSCLTNHSDAASL